MPGTLRRRAESSAIGCAKIDESGLPEYGGTTFWCFEEVALHSAMARSDLHGLLSMRSDGTGRGDALPHLRPAKGLRINKVYKLTVISGGESSSNRHGRLLVLG